MSTRPVPADPGRDESVLGWEPVITRPDPMTAEEWEIMLEHDLVEDLDPGELQCENDFWCPDAHLTGAELAEIDAANASNFPSAREVMAQDVLRVVQAAAPKVFVDDSASPRYRIPVGRR